MKISIITVVYNGASTIQDCLGSVLSQDYPDLEYIVIDGASTDDTLAQINTFDQTPYSHRITKLVSEPDKGLYDAMNKGILMATGDIVGMLNADDLYANRHCLSQIARLFESKPVGAVYADLVYVSQENPSKVTRFWKSGRYRKGAFLWGWMPPHPTFFVKRNLYHQYGLFNTHFRIAADYELMLRFIHKHRIGLAYLPKVIVKMRVGGISNSDLSHRLLAQQESRNAWTINGLSPYFFTLFLKPFRKISQFFSRNVTVN